MSKKIISLVLKVVRSENLVTLSVTKKKNITKLCKHESNERK